MFIFASCSNIEELMFGEQNRYERASEMVLLESSDYLDQLDFVGTKYIQEVKAARLIGKQAHYLESIYGQLRGKNEIVFDDDKSPTFYIIKDESSYHFSLPGRIFVFSSGLFKKFITNEEILIGILTFESIRSLKAIYKRSLIIPSLNMNSENFLKLFKIDSEEKIKVDQWVYIVLRRAGYDPGAYLKYLQMRNKINEEGSLVKRSGYDLVREEFMYKSFMVKQKIKGRGASVNKENSSKDFYALTTYVERI